MHPPVYIQIRCFTFLTDIPPGVNCSSAVIHDEWTVRIRGICMSDENKTRRPYAPRMSPHQTYEEINSYVVFWGLFFSVLFALAVGYLCLKIGQTVDAFAPVSVLAMGMAVLFHRRNAFPETVHI